MPSLSAVAARARRSLYLMMRRGACITFYLHTPQVRQPLRTYRHALALSSINAPPPRATTRPRAARAAR